MPGLQTKQIHVDIGFSRFDLALELELRQDALGGYFEYDEDLFAPATVDGLSEDFGLLLERVLEDPDVPVLAITLPRRATGAAGGRIARSRRS